MKKKVNLKAIQAFLAGENPREVNSKFYHQLKNTNDILRASEMTVEEICKIAGISESQYHRRRNKPTLWEEKELDRLFKVLSP